MILDLIEHENDIKKIPKEQLPLLAEEIREFLIENISSTGGHLASNLGAVELTMALHLSLELPKDKIIWDVGHQSYTHKILTGRRNEFDTLRKFGGLSGFPKTDESPCDTFNTGHSSTSISAGLGFVRARDLLGKDNKVVSVIGDGAMTGGMALEALNNAMELKKNFIIVLNDNQMSISKNVGGLSNHLNKLRLDHSYNKLKEDINSTLSNSNAGKTVVQYLHRVKDSLKHLLVPSMLFENMGVKYIGPIDGHDIELMNEVFSKAKEINGPVIIHTVTQKGKGYEFAEKNPNKFHGVSPFDLESGESYIPVKKTYSKVFGDTMLELAEKNNDIVAITAAMPDGTGLKEFAKKYSNRFFDVGIAEEHATTLAAGMASAGLRPVFAVYSTFLQRAFDQIIHDVCIQNLPVVFAIDRAGIVGDDGETHQGVFDLSYLSAIPNMTVLAPKHLEELAIMLNWAVKQNGPIAIRYPRGADCCEDISAISEIKYGKWEKIINGEKVAIIAVGKMVQHAMIARKSLVNKGINPTIIGATFIKPIDTEMLKELINEGYSIITIEDNVINGGFGSYVLMELNKLNFNGKFKCLGFNNEFVPHGDVNLLYRDAGLDAEAIEKCVINILG